MLSQSTALKSSPSSFRRSPWLFGIGEVARQFEDFVVGPLLLGEMGFVRRLLASWAGMGFGCLLRVGIHAGCSFILVGFCNSLRSFGCRRLVYPGRGVCCLVSHAFGVQETALACLSLAWGCGLGTFWCNCQLFLGLVSWYVLAEWHKGVLREKTAFLEESAWGEKPHQFVTSGLPCHHTYWPQSTALALQRPLRCQTVWMSLICPSSNYLCFSHCSRSKSSQQGCCCQRELHLLATSQAWFSAPLMTSCCPSSSHPCWTSLQPPFLSWYDLSVSELTTLYSSHTNQHPKDSIEAISLKPILFSF